MNVKTLAGLASGLSIAATLVSFADAYFLGSALSKHQYLPEQVPTYIYLSTVSFLFLVMLALSNRTLKLPYKDYTEKVDELQEKLDNHLDKDVELENLKAQIGTLQQAIAEEVVLERRIRGVLMANSETESGLIGKLDISITDKNALAHVQSMLGKMEQEKTIEASYGRYNLVKSF